MIRAVIFDIDGTMYDYETNNRRAVDAVRDYAVQRFGISEGEFQEAMKKASAISAERTGKERASSHNRLIRYQCLLEILGKPPVTHGMAMYHAYWDMLLNRMEIYPHLMDFIKLLKKQEIRIGAATNMTAYIQYEKILRLKLEDYIDWILTSEETGIEKPAGRFFELCMEKSGFRPEDCLFIGDSFESDILPALRFGMKAVLFKPQPENGMGNAAENAVKIEQKNIRFQNEQERSFGIATSYAACIKGWEEGLF